MDPALRLRLPRRRLQRRPAGVRPCRRRRTRGRRNIRPRRAQGLKPAQYRCAAESLLRRYRNERSRLEIHPLVDALVQATSRSPARGGGGVPSLACVRGRRVVLPSARLPGNRPPHADVRRGEGGGATGLSDKCAIVGALTSASHPPSSGTTSPASMFRGDALLRQGHRRSRPGAGTSPWRNSGRTSVQISAGITRP
jgi:hypothetical protein